MNSLANILGDSIRQLVPLSLPDGTDNLRFYLSKAFLPVIKFGSVYPAPPPAGHKSHANSLSVKPSRLRTLKTMASIHRSDFADLVHQYCDEYIPNTRMEHVVGPRYPEASKAGDSKSRTVNTSGAKLTIPNPEYFSGIAGISGAPAKITDIHHIIHLVKNGPLETVREILGVLYPELKHWEFIHGSIDADRKIFRYMTYANTTTEQVTGLGTRGGPLVVIAQPSWILTPRDMKSMSQTVELKWVTTVEGGEPYHQSTGRVWAKIWDTCRLADARFFILTNWQCWVFGAFSEGWSRAWSVFLDSDSDPTVMQSVIFWVSSAMDLPGAWHTPQVSERCPPTKVEHTCTLSDFGVSHEWQQKAAKALSLLQPIKLPDKDIKLT
ncbi:hypothetical protein BXZ70DRAFT_941976 [Cristinia sonorae]|uniref:Uncharacterized protein n=1 Tax=Cristinia sonorae TaxID=1940300 RepID=A0A8K0ULE8_9AGAR|nr:hypothetical protein BXZ70DRAFT_941976 [Cristinia sonorae]